jgi:hypothetical protein
MAVSTTEPVYSFGLRPPRIQGTPGETLKFDVYVTLFDSNDLDRKAPRAGRVNFVDGGTIAHPQQGESW